MVGWDGGTGGEGQIGSGVPVFARKMRSRGSTRLVYISQAAEVTSRRAVAAVDPTRAHEQQHTSRRHRAAAANT